MKWLKDRDWTVTLKITISHLKKNLANEEYISMAKMEFLYFQKKDVE